MSFTGPAEDRAAIRDLYDCYADASCRADREAWLACFADTASWWTHYFDLSGLSAIGAQFDQLMANVAQTIFQSQVLAIAVTGDTAQARAIATERLLLAPGGEHQLTGIYHDELVRADGQWRFASRTYKVITEEMLAP